MAGYHKKLNHPSNASIIILRYLIQFQGFIKNFVCRKGNTN